MLYFDNRVMQCCRVSPGNSAKRVVRRHHGIASSMTLGPALDRVTTATQTTLVSPLLLTHETLTYK